MATFDKVRDIVVDQLGVEADEDKIMVGPVPPKGCKACLKSCKHNFCIIDSLIRAEQGDVENGLVFTGEYIHRIKEILPVREIISRIKSEVAAID